LSAVASPIPRQDYANFKVGLQQGFPLGEMGFNDKFALQNIWLFSNSRRAGFAGDGCCGASDFRPLASAPRATVTGRLALRLYSLFGAKAGLYLTAAIATKVAPFSRPSWASF
jgi:hypothetical protein